MPITMEAGDVSAPQTSVSRRALIGGAVAAGAGFALPLPALAATGGEWRLAFRNVHNGDTVDALFARGGQFVPQGLAELAHGLRDWRTGEAHPIDRRLLALLVRLRDSVGMAPQRRIELISGYRSPHTNAALKSAGGEHSGVATRSQHMEGRATDIAMPGVRLDTLHRAALALRGGGVGYYPKDGFVHVDSAGVRSW